MAFQDVRELLGTANRPRKKLGEIGGPETWWVERQQALEHAGYMLRPRYRPDWIPSWAGTDKLPLNFEDGHRQLRRLCMDATRISDGKPVISSPPNPSPSDPRNHCAPLLDVIELPNDPPIMVHSLLRSFYDPEFQTFGEFVTFFAQICEGVEFMHENNVAHRDCTRQNIMLDPSNMYPESFHPVVTNRSRDFRRRAKAYSRTSRPTRYLLIDFGHSRRYDPSKGHPLDEPLRGADKSAPEHQNGTLCDPFPTDVYYLGNMIRENYSEKYKGFEFMEPLIADMVQEDPSKRPTMDKVTARFSEMKKDLSTWKAVNHWPRTVGYVLSHRAAIPEPS
ncbi:kinase-like domain-containing protein [Lactarius psammicola]|nr:kinase-like domain-containing protein [Lactarius psammicola]